MKKALVCLLVGSIATGIAGCKKEEPTQATAPQAVAPSAPVPAAPAAPAASDGKSYDFEAGTSGWKGMGQTQLSQSSEKSHTGANSLKVAGNAKAGLWSFAKSEKIGLTPGKRYRVTGWMLQEAKGQKASAFKCELWDGEKWLKNADVKFYDVKNRGQWQELSTEITAPEGSNVSLSIAVEKRPQDQAAQGTIYIDDVTVAKID